MHNIEAAMEKQMTCASSNKPTLSLHNNSQTISKAIVKPKIRIIHIFAPEIIKTDAENFRELVQRLTGKPTNTSCTRRKPRKLSTSKNPRIFPKQAEVAKRSTGFDETEFRERIKDEEEEEIWSGANSGGGFLSGLSEFEGFMQEINQFPLEGLQMDGYGYGDSQLNSLSQLQDGMV